MKFLIHFFPSCLFFYCSAQVTGIKTVPGSFPDIATAINTLNNQGVGAGGATINVSANYTETAPPGGYLLGSAILNSSLSSANPLVIQKNNLTSGANPQLLAFTGTSTTTDGIFKIAGADYVTINSMDLKESASNSNIIKQMEWGYAIIKLNASDGAQNININSCNVSLNKNNLASVGIYSGNHLFNDKTPLVIGSLSGTNANIRIDGCRIMNCYVAVSINGYTGSSSYFDSGLEIGTTAGNTISDYGGSVANTLGISTTGQSSIKIENNNISSASGSTKDVFGIAVADPCSGAVKINNNTISLSSSSSTNIMVGVNNSAAITSSVDITNNTIQNCNYATATSGNFYGIYEQGAGPGSLVNMNGNSFKNNVYGNTSIAGAGAVYAVYKAAGGSASVNANNNSITGNSLFGSTGGSFAGIFINVGTNQTVNNNLIDNNIIDGVGSGGTIIGIYTSSGNIINTNNQISNNRVLKSSHTGAIYGIYNNSSTGTENYNNNQVFGQTSAGNASVTGIYSGSSGTKDIFLNILYSMSSGGGTVNGIFQANSQPKIYKNKIYDLSSTTTSARVYGIQVGSVGSSTVYNNLVGDLKTPSGSGLNCINGMVINGGNCNLIFNTVYLEASSNSVSNFGSSAVFVASTSVSLLSQNNILVNKSVPGPAGGYTAAFRYVSTPGASYDGSSGNNLFYAGTSGSQNLIYGEGENTNAVNGQQGLSAYKTYIHGDAASVTEDPPFISTSGSNVSFLHIKSSVPTAIESGGIATTGIPDDFDGDSRNSTTPDIGADEFNGISIVLPVSIMAFNGSLAGTINYLTWKTASEQYCKGFYIERSNNGFAFKAIKFIKSASLNGNSNRLLVYSFADSSSGGGRVFYRLKQVDFNNKETLSSVITLENSAIPSIAVTLFPNPATDKINLNFYSRNSEMATITIKNASGLPVLLENFLLESGTSNRQFNLPPLTAGIYFVEIKSLTRRSLQNFIKL